MKATVAILTFNGERTLKKLLKTCFQQKTDFEYEVLIIDSGSSDTTLDIVKDFPQIRLHQIPNKEFGHGKTRNLAAKLAKGEFIVFVTQGVVPAHNHWLQSMIEPFSLTPDIVGVFGKQSPLPNTCPTIKRDMITTFASFGPSYAVTVQRANKLISDQRSLDALTFFSDANSAIRLSALRGKIPFRNVNYAEDQVFGKDVISKGLAKVYTPFGEVAHSRNYKLGPYFRRMFDEFWGLKNSTGQTLQVGLKELTLGTIKASIHDWAFSLHDRDYRKIVKVKWLLLIPFYNLERRLAIRLANKKRLPRWAKSFFSLEANQRRKNA